MVTKNSALEKDKSEAKGKIASRLRLAGFGFLPYG